VAPANGPGVWDVSLLVPPLLAPSDYGIAVTIASPYEEFVEEDVLRFRLWPRPDDRREISDRNRIVQPGVVWRVKPPAAAAGGQPETPHM